MLSTFRYICRVLFIGLFCFLSLYGKSAGEVLTLTLDGAQNKQCYETWTENSVPLSIVSTTDQDCSGGLCRFSGFDGGVFLSGARIKLNITSLNFYLTDHGKPIIQVEVDIQDGCRIGCTVAFLYRGTTVIDQAFNTKTGVPETLLLSGNGVFADTIAVSSCEGDVTEIRLTSITPCDGDVDCDRTVDGRDLAGLLQTPDALPTDRFAVEFGRMDCPPYLEISCPADLAIACHMSTEPGDTATPEIFACDPNQIEVTLSEEKTPGYCDNDWELQRTWTAVHPAGLTKSCRQIITVTDTMKPQIIGMPPDLIIQCPGDLPVPANVYATDNCTGLTLNFLQTADGDECRNEIIRIWTATDACGNQVIETQKIIIEDTTPPVLHNVPSDVILGCTEPLPSPAAVSATDNCDQTLSVSLEENVYFEGCAQTVVRTWTAVDGCGNTATASQTLRREE